MLTPLLTVLVVGQKNSQMPVFVTNGSSFTLGPQTAVTTHHKNSLQNVGSSSIFTFGVTPHHHKMRQQCFISVFKKWLRELINFSLQQPNVVNKTLLRVSSLPPLPPQPHFSFPLRRPLLCSSTLTSYLQPPNLTSGHPEAPCRAPRLSCQGKSRCWPLRRKKAR